MFSQELGLLVAIEYQRARIEDASRYRLLSEARRSRRGRRRAGRRPAETSAATGTLAACEPAAA